MYEFIKGFHNLLRWLVLLGGLYALITAARGLFSRVAWGEAENRAGRIFVSLIDVQIVVGVILYVISPLMRGAFANVSAAMQNPDLRFFVAEHLVIMVLAAVAAHVGLSLSRRAGTDRARFSRATAGYLISLILIFAGTPWGRSLIPWG